MTSRDWQPSDVEVNAAIDELAEKAMRGITGTSGVQWGQRAEIRRKADLLKNMLNAKPDHRSDADAVDTCAHCGSENLGAFVCCDCGGSNLVKAVR